MRCEQKKCKHSWFPKKNVWDKMHKAIEMNEALIVRCPKCNCVRRWNRYKVRKWVERREDRVITCRACGGSWFPTKKTPKECAICHTRAWK
jgi:hypothetical protein